jgi:hypothetical protein
MYSTLTSLSFILSLLLLGTTCRALLSPNSSHPSEAVVQQSLELAPPLPILHIGYMHMLGQASTNATQAEDDTSAGHHIQSDIAAPVHVAAAAPVPAAQCNATSPCVDASCCNSVGSVYMVAGTALIGYRKANAGLLRITVIPLLLRHASRTAMLMPCAELILSMASRVVLWDFAVRIWGTAE